MQNQSYDTETQQAKSANRLWAKIRTGWRHFTRFMVHDPAYSSQWSSIRAYRYGMSTRFSPYLETTEEQRQWLEKVYRQS